MSGALTGADFRGKRRECAFCKFFEWTEIEEGEVISGECRVRSRDPFPRRDATDWCGEWQLAKNGVWGHEQF